MRAWGEAGRPPTTETGPGRTSQAATRDRGLPASDCGMMNSCSEPGHVRRFQSPRWPLQGGLPRAHPSALPPHGSAGPYLQSQRPWGPRGPSPPGAPGKPCCPGAPGSPGWPENLEPGLALLGLASLACPGFLREGEMRTVKPARGNTAGDSCSSALSCNNSLCRWEGSQGNTQKHKDKGKELPLPQSQSLPSCLTSFWPQFP